MRVSFYTLGCKVNQNETGALEHLLCQNGYTLAGPDEAADVYIVNSCTVTASGDRKSRQWLRRAKRQNPGAVTVLTGCYPQAFPEEAAAVMEADLVTGSANRRSLLADIQKVLDSGERLVHITPHEKGEAFEELPMERFEGHTRAFIKVEDGCNRQCAYCVIPRARGRVRSRSVESVLEELRALSAAGYREVVLSGINLPSYGLDTGVSLVSLIEQAATVPGIRRIRLGSLEPDLLSDEDMARLAKVEALCPQFHLSLQSGCTATLRRMRRTYTAEQYADTVARLRAAFGEDRVSFTTDVIVGFPRRNRGGILREHGLCAAHWLFEGPCVPLLPPGRYPRRRLPRSDSGGGKGPPGAPDADRRRHRAGCPRCPHGGQPGRGAAGNAPFLQPVHRLHQAVRAGGGQRAGAQVR